MYSYLKNIHSFFQEEIKSLYLLEDTVEYQRYLKLYQKKEFGFFCKKENHKNLNFKDKSFISNYLKNIGFTENHEDFFFIEKTISSKKYTLFFNISISDYKIEKLASLNIKIKVQNNEEFFCFHEKKGVYSIDSYNYKKSSFQIFNELNQNDIFFISILSEDCVNIIVKKENPFLLNGEITLKSNVFSFFDFECSSVNFEETIHKNNINNLIEYTFLSNSI